MSDSPTGFIGLGNMGGPMAANLAKSGCRTMVYDAAGSAERAPQGSEVAQSTSEIARRCQTVLLCLPHGGISETVCREILDAPGRATTLVVDHSTIGVEAGRKIQAMLAEHGIEYVDAPVSGGVSGAVAGTISVMYSGSAETLEKVRSRFEAMAGNVFHVGEEPGLGQAMKVLNNFLSATAVVATSEAVAFGVNHGLDMKTILDVLNVSSGQNTASKDKFPKRVLTETYDAGFSSTQINKDLRLYREAVEAAGTADPVSPSVVGAFKRLETLEPGVDLTRMYPFIRDKR